MNSLKDLRSEVFKRAEEDNLLKNNAFRKIEVICGFGDIQSTKISFDDLKLFKVGERVEVNEEITFKKTYQDKNKMEFLTYMLDGGTFGVHSHDCYEFCEILKGAFFEKTRGLTKVYGVGETIIYAPNEEHIPYATKDTTLRVTFLKHLR